MIKRLIAFAEQSKPSSSFAVNDHAHQCLCSRCADPQRGDQFLRSGPIGRMPTATGKANGAGSINHKTARKLHDIPLRPTETVNEQRFDGSPPDRGTNHRPHGATRTLKGSIPSLLGVGQTHERQLQLFFEEMQSGWFVHRDQHSISARLLNLRVGVSHADRVLSTQSSAGVSHENQRDRTSSPQFRQLRRLAKIIGQRHVWSWITRDESFSHGHLPATTDCGLHRYR